MDLQLTNKVNGNNASAGPFGQQYIATVDDPQEAGGLDLLLFIRLEGHIGHRHFPKADRDFYPACFEYIHRQVHAHLG